MNLIEIETPENWDEMELHGLCTMFPEMAEDDYDRLVHSMKEHGFMDSDPIIIINAIPGEMEPTYQILDGRNRRNAAIDANVDDVVMMELEATEDEVLAFVIARNLDRRHLTTGQKAAIASKMATFRQGDNQFSKGMTQAEAADAVNVGEATVRRFKQVENKNPELAERVAKGEVPLETARKQVQETGKLGDKRKERMAKMEEEREAKIKNAFEELMENGQFPFLNKVPDPRSQGTQELYAIFKAGVDFIP